MGEFGSSLGMDGSEGLKKKYNPQKIVNSPMFTLIPK